MKNSIAKISIAALIFAGVSLNASAGPDEALYANALKDRAVPQNNVASSPVSAGEQKYKIGQNVRSTKNRAVSQVELVGHDLRGKRRTDRNI